MTSKYLEEFEKLNTTTDSIYDLNGHKVLIILIDGTNLTSWDDVEWKHQSDSKYNDDVLYISEDLSGHENLSERYKKLKSLRAIVALGVSDIVKNMEGMFSGCESLKDISSLCSWNVSGVTSMKNMFKFCESLVDLDALKSWDVSKVNNMESMFQLCNNLTDLSALMNWDMSSVTNMESMFWGCSCLIDLSALSDWNVSSVEYMGGHVF